jgi:hypothetical protein
LLPELEKMITEGLEILEKTWDNATRKDRRGKELNKSNYGMERWQQDKADQSQHTSSQNCPDGEHKSTRAKKRGARTHKRLGNGRKEAKKKKLGKKKENTEKKAGQNGKAQKQQKTAKKGKKRGKMTKKIANTPK